MKKLTMLFTAAVLMFAIAACDELGDLMQITFEDVEIEEIIDIPLGDFTARALLMVGEDGTKTFSDTTEISMANAEETTDTTGEALSDYLSKISEVDVDTFNLELLKNYEGVTLSDDFKVKTLNLKITNGNDSTLYEAAFNDITPGQVVETNLTDSKLNALSAELEKENGALTIMTSGEVEGSAGVDYFGIKAKIIADIKAGMSGL